MKCTLLPYLTRHINRSCIATVYCSGIALSSPLISHASEIDAILDDLLRNKNGINIDFRKQRCLDGQEQGFDPVWHSDTFYHDGVSWDRKNVCELQAADGDVIFHDGCTGQMTGSSPDGDGDDEMPWGEFFHNACVTHDHCYHHNPITYGYSRNLCDIQFQNNMRSICDDVYQTWWDTSRCKIAADTMYAAVAAIGSESYDVFNTYVEYNNPDTYCEIPPLDDGFDENWSRTWHHDSNTVDESWDVDNYYYVGNFDGGSDEEILVFNGSDSLWLKKYVNHQWQIIWETIDTSDYMMMPYGTNFHVGDFDGDGRDELLGYNSWVTMFHYKEDNQFHWGWSTGSNHHIIKQYRSTILAGNFNSGTHSEIIAMNDTAIRMFHFQDGRYSGSTYLGDSNHAIRPYESNGFLVGDFYGDAKDEILSTNSWTTTFRYDGSELKWGTSNYGSKLVGDWSTDWKAYSLVGKIEEHRDNEQLLFIEKNGNKERAASFFHHGFFHTSWANYNSDTLGFIDDWKVKSIQDTKYFLVKIGPSGKTQLLAIRDTGCRFQMARMYSPSL